MQPLSQPLILNNLLHQIRQPNAFAWEPFRPGVDIYHLYRDSTSGCAAALLRYQPGANVPLHRHDGFEHIVVLSGSQIDHHGEHAAGSVVINPPGTTHSVTSPAGCVVLVIWEKPVVILG